MMKTGKKRIFFLAATLGVSFLAGCSAGSSGDQTLRIASPSIGEKELPAWESARATFEAANKGWKVEFVQQNDDLYSTIGLPTLLNGKNSPDAFFEWAGARLDQRVKDGFAADISSDIAKSGLAARFTTGAFSGYEVNGKLSMIPRSKDITNVLWYNKDLFTAKGVSVPTTWDELLAACAKFKATGVTCFAEGNKDLWTVGNWGAHMISRVAGEQVYAETMQLKRPFASPGFIKGLSLLGDLATKGYINKSVNSISDNEGESLFFQGKAAMLPMGSWLIGIQKDQAPKFNMDFINLPDITGSAGNQKSIMAVYTGYAVNAKSSKKDKVFEFFNDLYADAPAKMINDSGSSLLLKSLAGGATDALDKKINTLLITSTVVVTPPDTGYSLKVADALNAAQAEVIGGQKSAQDALAAADAKVASLK